MSDNGINLLTTRFKSAAMEREFHQDKFDGNFRHNTIAILISIVVNSGYVVLDQTVLEHPEFAIPLRLSAACFSLILIGSLTIKQLRKYSEVFTAIVAFNIALVIILIIWREPTLENAYFIGLIQGGVFLSFLLRLSFLKSVSLLFFSLVLFAIAIFDKPNQQEAMTQFVSLGTMLLLCGFGVYLLQRYYRIDFAKTCLIEKQNRQLSVMLNNVSQDNERKIAAMNMLVHFVRTPIHQISGFTDIVLNELQQTKEENESCIQSANYIKDASNNLSSNVSKLLAYHRLDEIDSNTPLVKLNLTSLISDHLEQLDTKITTSFAARDLFVRSHEKPLQMAASALIAYFNDRLECHASIKVRLKDDVDRATVSFIYSDSEMSAEYFCESIKPLTDFDNYLTIDGDNMPMLLRTVEKALTLCNGALSYQRKAGANILTITINKETAGELGAVA